MWAVDVIFRRPHIDRLEDMNLPQAVWIGAVQVLSAVFPGTSRSMCTIAAGQTAGLSRSAALEFSFFLSMPTMVVATGYDLLKTIRPRSRDAADAALAPVVMTSHHWLVLAIGFVVSFIVALGGRRLVHALGAGARLCAVRRLPDRGRGRGAARGRSRSGLRRRRDS